MTGRTIRHAAAAALTVLSVLAAFAAGAAARRPVDTVSAVASARPLQNATPAAKVTLTDFSWLVGRWRGTWGPRVAEQEWTPPHAGLMVGTLQLTEHEKTLVIELLTIVQTPDGIEYCIRHFTPSLAAWEQNGPTTLQLKESDPRSIVFENPVGGQPKRIFLSRLDADTFVVRSEILPEKGSLRIVEITYHRQKEARASRRSRSSHHTIF